MTTKENKELYHSSHKQPHHVLGSLFSLTHVSEYYPPLIKLDSETKVINHKCLNAKGIHQPKLSFILTIQVKNCNLLYLVQITLY